MARTMRPLSRRLLSLHRQFHATSHRHDAASHSELLDRLKEIDSVALAKTKRLIATIGAHSTNLSRVVSATTSAAATIQLNPSIPPYKPNAWALHASSLPGKFNILRQRVARLDANLSDLECIPYRAETGEMEVQKLKEQIGQATEADKKTEYQHLKFQEDATAHRAKTFLDSLEASIDGWRGENGLKPLTGVYRSAFQRVEVGSQTEADKTGVPKVTGAEKGKKLTTGWGQGGTSLAEEDEGAKPRLKPMPFVVRKHFTGGDDESKPPFASHAVPKKENQVSSGSEASTAKQEDDNSREPEAKGEPQAPTPSEAASPEAEQSEDAQQTPKTLKLRKRRENKKTRLKRARRVAVMMRKESRESQLSDVEEVNSKEHEEKKESKAPAPSKPKGLFALQAEIDRSLKA